MFEGSFDPAHDRHRLHHVGAEKYRVHEHQEFSRFFYDTTHIAPKDPKSWKGGLKGAKGPATLTFTLVESQPLENPAFNVLFVRTEKPSIMRLPPVRYLIRTWGEAMDLLKPLARFGIPETALKDKCKWWRDDRSALPGALSLQTQRMLKSLDSEYTSLRSGRKRSQAMAHAATYWNHKGHGAGGSHGHGHHKHLSPFAAKEEFIEAVMPWVVLGLNLAAWSALGSSTNQPLPM